MFQVGGVGEKVVYKDEGIVGIFSRIFGGKVFEVLNFNCCDFDLSFCME